MDTEHRSALPSVLRESLEKEGAALTGAGRRKNIHMGLWACIVIGRPVEPGRLVDVPNGVGTAGGSVYLRHDRLQAWSVC